MDFHGELMGTPPRGHGPMESSPKEFHPTQSPMKYVVVLGGVCSSLGKGVIASSVGALLRADGFHVTAIKIDPYINPDAGLMSPFEHGEVFVLDDGGEADLDLGNYERTMGLSLARGNNITTGKVFSRVIEMERAGHYGGKTVQALPLLHSLRWCHGSCHQIVPHVTGEIIRWIDKVAHVCSDGSGVQPDVCVVELGGTVGDIEQGPFTEALRQMKLTLPRENFCLVLTSLVPMLCGQKTKPTQHSVKSLRSLGLSPQIICCRCEEMVEESTRRKVATQCSVGVECVLSAHNVPNLYRVPLLLHEQGMVSLLGRFLRLDIRTRRPSSSLVHSDMLSRDDWKSLADSIDAKENVKICVVGKYTRHTADITDSYISVMKALEHAAMAVHRRLEASAESRSESLSRLERCDGILVPGGFGERGYLGKIAAIHFARTRRKPFLGICLGMQLAVLEHARNILGWTEATSEELSAEPPEKELPYPFHALKYMPEIPKDSMGANMRLGSRIVLIKPDSITSSLYGGVTKVMERHRHRYEVNPDAVERLQDKGLVFVSKDDTGLRMEVLERPDHPFFLATQYHPEFKSRPADPAPPFHGLLLASVGKERLEEGLAACRERGCSARYRPLERNLFSSEE